MKHTPEPWTVDDLRPDGNLEIVGGDDVLVAEVDPDGSEEEVLANAALIAAAPDLLAACEGMIDLCKTLLLKDCGFYSPDNNGYIQTARWAIAKAKGE